MGYHGVEVSLVMVEITRRLSEPVLQPEVIIPNRRTREVRVRDLRSV
jgi:hypothetical protein